MTVCICIASHFSELPRARKALEAILPLPPGYSVNFLLIDENHIGLKSELQKIPSLNYFEEKDLGSADPLYFLLQSTPARAAQVLGVLTPSVVMPSEGLSSLVDQLISLPQSGVVGPVVAREFVGVDGKKQTTILNAGYAKGFSISFPFSSFFSDLVKRGALSFTEAKRRVALGDLRFDHKILNFLHRSKTYEVGIVPSACFLFRRSLLDQVGWLGSGESSLLSSVDFCRRASQVGFLHYVCGDVKAIKIDPTVDAKMRNLFESPVEDNANAFAHVIKKDSRLDEALTMGQLVGGAYALEPESPLSDFYRRMIGWKKESPSPRIAEPLKIEDEEKRIRQYDELFKSNQALRNARMLSEKSPHERKDYLRTFKNKHKGQRCFIIGNGPSLNETDLSLLKNEFTFAVNGIFYKRKDIGFRPSYFVVEDNHVIADNVGEINQMIDCVRFFPERYADQINSNEKTHFLPTDWNFYDPESSFFEVPRFSKEISEVIYTGQTVTYLNLQLAYYMGFSEVYLIGVDFSYTIPESAKIDGHTITSQDNDPNHFHPDYFGKGKKWHDPKLYNCLKTFLLAKEVFEQSGRKVCNATIGGMLEAFPRADYYSLFGKVKPAPGARPNSDIENFIKAYRQKYPTGPEIKEEQFLPSDFKNEGPIILRQFDQQLSRFLQNWKTFSARGWSFWCRQHLCVVANSIDQEFAEDLSESVRPPLESMSLASPSYLLCLLEQHSPKGRYLRMLQFQEKGPQVMEFLIKRGIPFLVTQESLILKW